MCQISGKEALFSFCHKIIPITKYLLRGHLKFQEYTEEIRARLEKILLEEEKLTYMFLIIQYSFGLYQNVQHSRNVTVFDKAIIC